MNTAGPSPTYRGYRRQALYTLSRVLLDSNAAEQSYRPEGAEDLYVFDNSGVLREAVQVKDYSAALCLSDFEPRKRVCFFYRVHERLTACPSAGNRLASFGTLGPELENCLGQDGAKMRQSAAKLIRYQAEAAGKIGEVPLLSQEAAEKILRAITVEVVNESSLRARLLEHLKMTSAGAASEVAFDLLLFWVFLASENATLLSRDGVLRKLQQISAALAALQSHHQEWGRTIIPLSEGIVTAEERDQLAKSFREGAQAHWRHIVADLDIRRDERLAEMRTKLSQCRVLIVHGASGQGKSTLAYRYLRDFSADGWRFQVSTVAGRDHALNICMALESHATALGIPAYVMIDVMPNDEGWTDLVIRLARHPTIRILVVVREEDFHRAHFDQSSCDLEQIDLQTLTENEGRRLYDGLVGARAAPQFLEFNDAWRKFGGAGPLLEFTYLVQQGETLRDRLRQQVERLRAESLKTDGAIRPLHLEFLALVATASEYECRLDVAATCKHLGFSLLLDPIAPFDKEYLIRAFREVGAVGGLHAIRSRMLVEYLFRAAPEKWCDYAKSCISLLLPADLERFLLCAFSRRPEHADELVAELKRAHSLTWMQLGGAARALLWLGVSRYEEENRALLDPLTKIMGVGWWLVFGSLITDRDPERVREFREVVKKLHYAMAPIMEKVVPTPKENAFKIFRDWVAGFSSAPVSPVRTDDWLGLGEISCWIGYLDLPGTLRRTAETVVLDPILDTLGIRDMSAVLLGVAQLKSVEFSSWHRSRLNRIRERFVRDTLSLHLGVADGRVEVSFLIENEEGSPDLNEQAMHRLRILRGLFPYAAVYASQGCGYEGLPFELTHDPTTEEIRTDDLPMPYMVGLNALFIALVKYRHLRASDWNVFLDRILEGRRAMVISLGVMERGLDRLLAKRSHTKLWDVFVKKTDWSSGAVSVPELPASAVDEWGYSSDGRGKETTSLNESITRQETVALATYAGPLKAMNDFANSIGLFRGQFEDASQLCLLYRQIGSEGDREKLAGEHTVVRETEPKRRLALFNLAEARKQLPAFQGKRPLGCLLFG